MDEHVSTLKSEKPKGLYLKELSAAPPADDKPAPATFGSQNTAESSPSVTLGLAGAGSKITITPEQEALYRFDAEHNVEPTRETAIRIATGYGHPANSSLVDEISHAVEDAYEIGQKRGLLLKAAGLM